MFSDSFSVVSIYCIAQAFCTSVLHRAAFLLHNSRRSVHTLYIGPPFPPKIASSHRGSGSHLIHDSLGPSEPTTHTTSPSVQPFLHSSRQNVLILDNGPPLPPKLPIFMGICTPNNTGFLGPTRVHNSNSISIGSAVFALQSSRPWQTDRPTDRQEDQANRSVTIGRMRPNYNNTSGPFVKPVGLGDQMHPSQPITSWLIQSAERSLPMRRCRAISCLLHFRFLLINIAFIF